MSRAVALGRARWTCRPWQGEDIHEPTELPDVHAPLDVVDGRVACAHGHQFTSEGLALAGNLLAIRALWLAVRALEDDAAGLEWMLREQRAPVNQQDDFATQAAEGRKAA